ncbi:GATA transcription factor 9-like [Salvia hispanica]|uniref:GATA transcription factor 9-like n=1 Tax=Salvia hispanica TaxID=49212 RepID=UPI002009D982|nr:GATA transcription factor 9-like [Salvia hispanica]
MEQAAPEFFEAGYYDAVLTSERRLSDAKNGDNFIVDDLLDLPNDDTLVAGEAEPGLDASPVVATLEPHVSATDVGGARAPAPTAGHYSGELCVPYDELAELEWLSNFVEESFSSEDLQKLQLIQGRKARNDDVSSALQYPFQPETPKSGPILRPELSVPAKARSKRSRAAPGSWSSRLVVVSPTRPAAIPALSSSSESNVSGAGAARKAGKAAGPKKRDGQDGGEGRKCLHCATDKTPQWRTGPMGPKTLCNACGVRYKSGRLVPEYRPAASPTFVLTKHSNSHRKVMELRRQKAQPPAAAPPYMHHHQHQNVVFDVSNGDDYLIHQHMGPDFRQLI